MGERRTGEYWDCREAAWVRYAVPPPPSAPSQSRSAAVPPTPAPASVVAAPGEPVDDVARPPDAAG